MPPDLAAASRGAERGGSGGHSATGEFQLSLGGLGLARRPDLYQLQP